MPFAAPQRATRAVAAAPDRGFEGNAPGCAPRTFMFKVTYIIQLPETTVERTP
ncbi:hypothetical protein HMPREF0043_00993 [Actinobaculum sp. oral taxon 183 str. F0552]|nr:hypothetical protein HMPREF0043_00993 [Actinobaculum sp. oral taxon 183 str. F0552]